MPPVNPRFVVRQLRWLRKPLLLKLICRSVGQSLYCLSVISYVLSILRGLEEIGKFQIIS